jgi:hypothetical protein
MYVNIKQRQESKRRGAGTRRRRPGGYRDLHTGLIVQHNSEGEKKLQRQMASGMFCRLREGATASVSARQAAQDRTGMGWDAGGSPLDRSDGAPIARARPKEAWPTAVVQNAGPTIAVFSGAVAWARPPAPWRRGSPESERGRGPLPAERTSKEGCLKISHWPMS